MSKGNSSHFSGTNGANKALVDELTNSGAKCTPENIVGITKDTDGRIIWLETGTATAGLHHIIDEHGSQFQDKGISNDEIPNYIMKLFIKETLLDIKVERILEQYMNLFMKAKNKKLQLQ